ncbi:MAG TPA: sulfite exporter TauE/SafE family protein [Longimicrobiales bacterium]|nr:sulfite exporter TauE/SafE family protein [Longimicrobiales bacterium]
MPLGLLLAGVVGLALGLLGGGGSILAVPIFVYVLGYEAKEAIAMSLAVVGFTSLAAAIGHWRSGNVDLRVAGVFGPVAMAGAYAGARLAELLSGTFQLSLFAAVMLVSAVFMFRGSSPRLAAAPEPGRMPLGLIMAEGLLVGTLTGLVGVGGGFLIVPALALLGKLPIRVAIGTSVVLIAMNSAAGLAGYLGHVQVPWMFVSAFAVLAAAGAVGGSQLVRFVPQHVLRRSFAALLVVVGMLILYQNRTALLPGHASPAAPVLTHGNIGN